MFKVDGKEVTVQEFVDTVNKRNENVPESIRPVELTVEQFMPKDKDKNKNKNPACEDSDKPHDECLA